MSENNGYLLECPPSGPGAILKTQYMEPNKWSATYLAEITGFSRKHISNVINGRARVNTDLALKLSEVCDTTAEFWLSLQNKVDIYNTIQRERK